MEMLVQIEEKDGRTFAFKFESSFRVGRDSRCVLALPSPYVSRIHAHVTLENGTWWITDLASSNGTFCQGQSVDRQQVESGHRYYLSKRGPRLTFFDLAARDAPWRASLRYKTVRPLETVKGGVTQTSILSADDLAAGPDGS